MNVYANEGQSVNYQYGVLTIVEASPSGDNYFDKDKDRFFDCLVQAGIVSAKALKAEDPGWYVHRRYQVNFVQYCDDEDLASVADLDSDDLRCCQQKLNNYLMTTQTDVVVFVGAALVRKYFKIQCPRWGLFKEKRWENSGRISCFFLVPNTRRVNRSDSEETVQKWFTELSKLMEERHLGLLDFGKKDAV